LQRVLVLAIGVDTAAERSSDKPARTSLLTLSVSLQEAQLLSLAQSLGRLTVVLRGVNDPRVFDSPPDINRTDLYDLSARQAVQRPSRRPTLLEGAVR
jgi:pilus assembly protein CpaB